MIEQRGRAPAVPAAVALAAGTALAGCFSAHLTAALTAAGFLIGAGVHLVVGNGGRAAGGARRWPADVAALAALALAAALHAQVRLDRLAPDDIARALPPGNVTVTGHVVESRARADGGCRLVVAADSLRSPAGTKEVSGKVWVTSPAQGQAPARGSRVRVRGRPGLPRGPTNPGAFDFPRYLRSRGVRLTLRARSLEVVAEPRRAGDRLRARIEEVLAQRFDADVAPVLRGLLLGASDGLGGDTLETFRRSGTVHVLAVSGLHIALLLLMIRTFLRAARVPRRAALVGAVLALPLFVAVVGPRPSAIRATLMATVYAAAALAQRKTSAANVVGLAALALLVARPGDLHDLGFRLSFGAAAGIVGTFAAVRRPLAALAPVRNRWAGGLVDALALSTSAQLGVAPVLLASFGRLSMISPLANLPAVPLAGASLACGLLSVVSDIAVPAAAPLFSGAGWAAAAGLAHIAEGAAAFPWAVWCPGTWFAVPAALVSLAVGFSGRPSRSARRSAWCLAAAALIAAALGRPGEPGATSARVTFYDVGQGDAALVEAAGERVLIDAGPAGAGGAVIAPLLMRDGISRLDALVVTHAHADHFGGAAEVMRSVRVERLFVPPGRASHPELGRVAAAAESLGVAVEEVARGDTLFLVPDGPSLVLLWPSLTLSENAAENDASIVALLLTEGGDALFTGDIERRAEAEIIAAGGPPPVDVLKVAHHGSATSSCEDFVGRTSPSVAVVSVGRFNRHGHPDEATLARLERLGALVLRTDRDGAVIVAIRDHDLSVRTVGSGRSALLRSRSRRERRG